MIDVDLWEPIIMATDETDFYLGCRARRAMGLGKTAVVIAVADPATGRFGVRYKMGLRFE